MNTGLRIITAALLALCLTACGSSTSSSGSGRGFTCPLQDQESLDLRLEALDNYEAWLGSKGFSANEAAQSSRSSADASASKTVNWSSQRFTGKLPHLGDVEILIEKRGRLQAQQNAEDRPDIYVHLRIRVELRSEESEAAWQHLKDDADAVVLEGRFEAR